MQRIMEVRTILFRRTSFVAAATLILRDILQEAIFPLKHPAVILTKERMLEMLMGLWRDLAKENFWIGQLMLEEYLMMNHWGLLLITLINCILLEEPLVLRVFQILLMDIL